MTELPSNYKKMENGAMNDYSHEFDKVKIKFNN